jgi:hypothetical protein
MVKVCGTCKESKDIAHFGFKDKEKKIRRSYCKKCQASYVKKHYQANPDYYKKKARERNDRIIEENYNKLYKYLEEHSCVDCGETDTIVLEFDHLDPKDKVMEVTLLVRGAYCWETIELEISKCEVRCANCHRRKTAKQYGWRERASVGQKQSQ